MIRRCHIISGCTPMRVWWGYDGDGGGVVKGGASVLTPHHVLARPAAQQREWGLLSALALLFLYLAQTYTAPEGHVDTSQDSLPNILQKSTHKKEKKINWVLQQTCYWIWYTKVESSFRWIYCNSKVFSIDNWEKTSQYYSGISWISPIIQYPTIIFFIFHNL